MPLIVLLFGVKKVKDVLFWCFFSGCFMLFGKNAWPFLCKIAYFWLCFSVLFCRAQAFRGPSGGLFCSNFGMGRYAISVDFTVQKQLSGIPVHLAGKTCWLHSRPRWCSLGFCSLHQYCHARPETPCNEEIQPQQKGPSLTCFGSCWSACQIQWRCTWSSYWSQNLHFPLWPIIRWTWRLSVRKFHEGTSLTKRAHVTAWFCSPAYCFRQGHHLIFFEGWTPRYTNTRNHRENLQTTQCKKAMAVYPRGRTKLLWPGQRPVIPSGSSRCRSCKGTATPPPVMGGPGFSYRHMCPKQDIPPNIRSFWTHWQVYLL